MSNLAQDRQALLEMLRKKSVLHGDFTLSSGAKSTYYIDCRLTTISAAGAWLVGSVLQDMIQREAAKTSTRVDAVGGLTLGADPIALATGMISQQRNPQNFYEVFTVRKVAKGHGATKLVEGNFRKGDQVVVVDDVVTKGDSTLKAIEAIEAEGGKVLFAAVLVDRQEGGKAKIEEKGYRVLAAFTKQDLLG